MIYLTQLIFVHEGREEVFHQFEDRAIPLMEKYHGRMLYRLRPDASAYVSGEAERPYEIHFMSFDSEQDLQDFLSDKSRQEFIHLKDESVKSSLLVRGVA